MAKTIPKSDAEQIAASYARTHAALVRTGRALHDHVGSSLSAAGVQLQLLSMDVPEAQSRIAETLRTLEETLEKVRALSHELCPSPAYRGSLKQGLERLTGQYGNGRCRIELEYDCAMTLPAEIAAAAYEAAAGATEQALASGAARIGVRVSGKGRLTVRIADNGRKTGRARALAAIRTLARAQGLAFECTTGKSTIVSIRYADRRSARG